MEQASTLDSKTETELQIIIDKATEILKRKSEQRQKAVITEIKALAASINMKVEIYSIGEHKSAKNQKVPYKYRDTNDPNNTWKGRGLQPKWLQEHIKQGRQLSDFLVESQSDNTPN